jgi:formylglycine-generating enzyme required for sulfatase activity
MKLRVFLFLLCLGVAVGGWRVARMQQGNAPLTLAKILTGLQTQSRDPQINTLAKRNSYIARRVRQVGVTFTLTPDRERDLLDAGASDELIAAIREKALKPPAPKPAPTSQPTATPQRTLSQILATRDNYTETLPGGVKLDMVAVAPGSFTMGSSDEQIAEAKKNCDSCNFDDEKPQRAVNIAYGFFIGKFEVTQAQWQAVMGNNSSNFKNCPECPVEQVSWNDAKEFIKKLNSLQNKYFYRLPSEAEWEYTVRAGTKTAFAFGDSLSSKQANFDGNYPYGGAAKGEYKGKTTPVGSYAPNAWGLYDMHGNVWEWCEDIYQDNYKGLATDGSANVSVGDSSPRVLRGGSWNNNGINCRSANRYRNAPDGRYFNIGFRLVAVART